MQLSSTQRIRGLLYLFIIGVIIATVKVDTAIRQRNHQLVRDNTISETLND